MNHANSNGRVCSVGNVSIGAKAPLAIIAGPCLLESPELGLAVGRSMKAACEKAGLPYIFKASFDKANRSSIRSARGPGLKTGLAWLAQIGKELRVPVTTDIHEPEQAGPVAEVIDLLQIPAFLCRQTDLLCAAGEAASKHRRAVNVKKGQFLSPGEMAGAIRKLTEAGCTNFMLTERGTTFGYHRLVNDFIGMGEMMELACDGGSPPVCFDCTHSTQTPGTGETTGGKRKFSPLLARAAVAAGVHALFLECHPQPDKAMSDASTMLDLESAAGVIEVCGRIRGVLA